MSYSISEDDTKHEINLVKEFALEGVKAAYIAQTIVQSTST